MPNHDDNRLEAYMKGFRPTPAAPLPLQVSAGTARKPRHFGITVWTLAATAILMLGICLLRVRHPARFEGNSTAAFQPHSTQPLTLRSANELLINSPSFKAALESLQSNSGAAALIPKDKKSAFLVLSQEDVKP